jgi:hypothetical protein
LRLLFKELLLRGVQWARRHGSPMRMVLQAKFSQRFASPLTGRLELVGLSARVRSISTARVAHSIIDVNSAFSFQFVPLPVNRARFLRFKRIIGRKIRLNRASKRRTSCFAILASMKKPQGVEAGTAKFLLQRPAHSVAATLPALGHPDRGSNR